MARYQILVEVNEHSTWPDGSAGLINALGGPLDNADNRLLWGIVASQLWRVAISALSVTPLLESTREQPSQVG